MIESEDHDLPAPLRRPLPVTIVRGSPVYETCDGTAGIVVGFAQAYCIYRAMDGDQMRVAHWRELALGNICPAEPLLPTSVCENDRRNANATVLRELLLLERLGPLTPAQTAVCEELVAYLCSD